jgi:hypothetical protein
MARFVTIGDGEQAGHDRTDSTVRKAAHAHDARLLEDGCFLFLSSQDFTRQDAAAHRGHRPSRGI